MLVVRRLAETEAVLLAVLAAATAALLFWRLLLVPLDSRKSKSSDCRMTGWVEEWYDADVRAVVW